jgi:hypothetical protein
MKKLLMAAAAVAILATPALASNKTNISGTYCGSSDPEVIKLQKKYNVRDYLAAIDNSECLGNYVKFTPTSFKGADYGCKFRSVRKSFDRGIAADTRNVGVDVFRVTARCEFDDQECSWNSTWTMYVSQGTLFIRNRRDGKHTCVELGER